MPDQKTIFIAELFCLSVSFLYQGAADAAILVLRQNGQRRQKQLPGISDPGFLLVRACLEAGIEVETLPGATAFVPALVASGLPNEKFCFEGFLPQKKGRQTRLKELALEYRTIIFYESPFRLLKTLTQFAEFFGTDRQVSVSREISKLHEETVRGSLEEVIQHFTVNEPRGEIVIVLAGLKDKKDKETEKDV